MDLQGKVSVALFFHASRVGLVRVQSMIFLPFAVALYRSVPSHPNLAVLIDPGRLFLIADTRRGSIPTFYMYLYTFVLTVHLIQAYEGISFLNSSDGEFSQIVSLLSR